MMDWLRLAGRSVACAWGAAFLAFVMTPSSRAGEGPLDGAESAPSLPPFAFLARSRHDDKPRLLVYENGASRTIEVLPIGTERLWDLWPPFLAFTARTGKRGSVYFMNLRSGSFTERAAVGGGDLLPSLVLSPGGDRAVSLEEGPLGKLIRIDGVFLDETHEILVQNDGNFVPCGWDCAGERVILTNPDSGVVATVAVSSKRITDEFVVPGEDRVDSVAISCDKRVAAVVVSRSSGDALLIYRPERGFETVVERESIGDIDLSRDGRTALSVDPISKSIVVHDLVGGGSRRVDLGEELISSPLLLEGW